MEKRKKQFKLQIKEVLALMLGVLLLLLAQPVLATPPEDGEVTINGANISGSNIVNTNTLFGGGPVDPLGFTNGGIILNVPIGFSLTGPVYVTPQAEVVVNGKVWDGSSTYYSVLGGASLNTTAASGYTVTVTATGEVGNSASQMGSVVGGVAFANDGLATQNTVNIYGTVHRDVTGGGVNNGTASFNTVNVYDGAITTYAGHDTSVRGGMAELGHSLNNTVNIYGGAFGADIAGGEVKTSDVGSQVYGNKIYVKTGASLSYDASLFGGYVSAGTNATVSYNHVQVEAGVNLVAGTDTSSAVLGGAVNGGANATVSYNSVNYSATALPNVSVTGGGIGGGVVGTNVVSFNTVDFYGEANQVIGGIAMTASGSTSQALNNTVNLHRGKVANDVYGGVTGGNGDTGTSNGNTVNLAGGVEVGGTVYGGAAWGGGTAQNNTVAFHGANVTGNVYGGTAATASGNKVIFHDGENTVGGFVRAAGDLEVRGGTNSIGGVASAVNLTVSGGDTEFGSNLTIAQNSVLSGGKATVKGNFSTAGILSVENAELVLDGGFIHAGSTADFGNGALLTLKANSASTASGLVTFASGSTMDLGDYNLTLTGSMKLADGSAIKGSGGRLGASGTITADTGLVTLDLGFGKYNESDAVVTAGTTLTAEAANFRSVFYGLEKSGDAILIAASKGLGQGLEAVAEDKEIGSSVNYENAAALVSRIGQNGPASLVASLSDAILDIDAISDPGLAEIAIKQLIGESLVNVGQAVADTFLKAQGVVFGRLDRIREVQGGLVPPAAGQAEALNRFWLGGFGVWAKSRNRNDVYGYDYESGGIALGYDRQVEALPGLRLGASMAFSKGSLDNNDGYSSVDIDTFGIGVYGSYLFDNNLFLDGSVAYGQARNHSEVKQVLGGKKVGDFDIDSLQLGARFGAVLQAGSFQFIPSLGVRYTSFSQDGWHESLKGGASGPANRFAKVSGHQVDIPLQLKINTSIEAGSALVTPELRLGLTYAAKRADNSLRVGFVGSSDTATLYGVKAKRATFNAGAGVKVNASNLLDFYVNYDFAGASGYKEHNLSAGLGFEF